MRKANDLEPTREAVHRFWGCVPIGPANECWLWTGTRVPEGYGRLSVRCKGYVASRLMWLLFHGRQPTGFICHRCDNPPCVNPAHLFDATHEENMADMVAKGRSKPFFGTERWTNPLKTHCKYGHPYAGDNLNIDPSGHRWCRACSRRRSLESYRRKHAPKGAIA